MSNQLYAALLGALAGGAYAITSGKIAASLYGD